MRRKAEEPPIPGVSAATTTPRGAAWAREDPANVCGHRTSSARWVIGACVGQVAGQAVAAAFGRFNPKGVVPAVEAGWQVTSRDGHNYEQGLTAEGLMDVWFAE